VRGADPAFDAAAEAMPVIEEFLRQEGTAAVPFEETRQGLLALASGIHA
jgi:flagellar biosynthesis/type III secretory pathway ATPase